MRSTRSHKVLEHFPTGLIVAAALVLVLLGGALFGNGIADLLDGVTFLRALELILGIFCFGAGALTGRVLRQRLKLF